MCNAEIFEKTVDSPKKSAIQNFLNPGNLKKKSVYASFDDIVKFACKKYSLGEIHNFSICTDYLGDYEGNKYVVEASEIKLLEKEHITELVYCNVFRDCRLSWFYTSIGNELLPKDMAIVDDELIQKATNLVGYDSKNDFAKALADVIEEEVNWDDKFIASLILAKEMAKSVNGVAVLIYDRQIFCYKRGRWKKCYFYVI